MLAYYLELHMRRKLKPLMFAEETPPRKENPVAPAPQWHSDRCNGPGAICPVAGNLLI